MQYRTLGRSEIQVSTIAMGCWAIAGDWTWGSQAEADAVDAIHASLDAGVTLFDTAPLYGDGYSERLLGRALGDRRDKAVIATKVSQQHLAAGDLIASCDESLARLGTDHIDLLQAHWPNWDIPTDETFAAFESLVRMGKVRAIGVSNFGPRDLADALPRTDIVSNQLVYSLLARSIEFDIMPVCREHNLSILPYSPLAQGLLTGKFQSADDVPDTRARTRHFSSDRPHTRHEQPGCEAQTFAAIADVRAIASEQNLAMNHVALAWLLAQPMVASVLAGARNRQQALDNAQAGDVQLDEQVIARLSDATDPVKQALGAEPDLWMPPGQSRIR